MVPAQMHGAGVLGIVLPMYFIQERSYADGAAIQVVTMTNYLSNSPTFVYTNLPVQPYLFPPTAQQPGGTAATNDTTFTQLDWRGGKMTAAHTIGVADDAAAKVRWYQIDTTGAAPSLIQQGTIDPGPGISTYFGSVGGEYALAVASGAPLLAASAPEQTSPDSGLTEQELQPLVREALRRWQASGVDVSQAEHVELRITNLDGVALGLASDHAIYLDDNAAGWGWFVDPTPRDDAEYLAAGNQGEQNRMDLLSVVMHELGHVLGYQHEDDGVMVEALAAGVRRTALRQDAVVMADQVIRQSSDHRADAWLGAWLNEQFESTQLQARRRTPRELVVTGVSG